MERAAVNNVSDPLCPFLPFQTTIAALDCGLAAASVFQNLSRAGLQTNAKRYALGMGAYLLFIALLELQLRSKSMPK